MRKKKKVITETCTAVQRLLSGFNTIPASDGLSDPLRDRVSNLLMQLPEDIRPPGVHLVVRTIKRRTPMDGYVVLDFQDVGRMVVNDIKNGIFMPREVVDEQGLKGGV